MAPRTSGTASGPDRPPGAVEPAPLPTLGTTWVERGGRYWVRRCRFALRAAPFALLGSFAAVAVYAGVASLVPSAVRPAVHIAEGAAALAALTAGWVRQRRANRVPVTPEAAWANRRRAARTAAGAYGKQGLAILMAPVLPAVMAYVLGLLLGAVFVRVTAAELGAREDYERRLAAAEQDATREARLARTRRAPRNGPSWR